MAKPIREVSGRRRDLSDELLTATDAAGAARPGRAVAAGARRAFIDRAGSDYLRRFYHGAPMAPCWAAGDQGRFFYNDDLSGFNFQPVHAKLTGVLDELEATATLRSRRRFTSARPDRPCLPGFRQNDLGWRRASAGQHLDRQPHPHRRPLRPAGQCGGGGGRPSPLHPVPAGAGEATCTWARSTSPAGQPVSLVDFHIRTSRNSAFAEALQHAAALNWTGRATPCSSPACGGTTSKRWTPSTC
jgi:hypothetical protein